MERMASIIHDKTAACSIRRHMNPRRPELSVLSSPSHMIRNNLPWTTMVDIVLQIDTFQFLIHYFSCSMSLDLYTCLYLDNELNLKQTFAHEVQQMCNRYGIRSTRMAIQIYLVDKETPSKIPWNRVKFMSRICHERRTQKNSALMIDTCPICLDEKKVIPLKCTHRMCNTCLHKWFNIKGETCPVCRCTSCI